MSKRGDILRLRSRLRMLAVSHEEVPLRFFGQLGDGMGNAIVAGQPNVCNVRVPGRGVIQCQNTKVAARDGLYVAVGYTHARPDTLQILDIWDNWMLDLGRKSYLPFHHQAHELNNPYGGDDVVWSDKQQYLPLLALPTQPPTMHVNIHNDVYAWLSTWKQFPDTLSASLAGSVPGGAWQARYTLISIDGATNALQYTDGGIFNYVPPPVDPFAHIPALPVGCVPIVAVYLPVGTTELLLSNLVDVRFINAPGGGSLTPGPHGFLDSTVHTGTATQAPTRGSLVVVDAADDWNEVTIGTAHQLLKVNAGGTDPAWASFDWDDIAAAAAADMTHDHGGDAEGGVPNAAFDKIIVAEHQADLPTCVISRAGNIVVAL